MTQDTRSQLCTSAAAFAENNFLVHLENAPFATDYILFHIEEYHIPQGLANQ
jgi:hypothetical protein